MKTKRPMREIKFRQYVKEWSGKKIWFYWGFIGGAFISPQNQVDESQQFTGLKDKNGKEIYEGDILANPIYKVGEKQTISGYVFYSRSFAQFVCRGLGKGKPTDKMKNISSLSGDVEMKIIGNIWENKELLDL